MQEYGDAGLLFRIVRSGVHEHATRRTPSLCFAPAASGHAAIAPPRSVMNPRRLTSNMSLLPACAISAMIPANDLRALARPSVFQSLLQGLHRLFEVLDAEL